MRSFWSFFYFTRIWNGEGAQAQNQDLFEQLKYRHVFKAPYLQSAMSSVPSYLFLVGKRRAPVDVPRCQSLLVLEPGADVARRMLQAKTISRYSQAEGVVLGPDAAFHVVAQLQKQITFNRVLEIRNFPRTSCLEHPVFFKRNKSSRRKGKNWIKKISSEGGKSCRLLFI